MSVSVAPFLRAVFIREDTPFAAQAASMQVNTMGQANLEPGPPAAAKQTLSKVQDLLHQLLAAGNGDQALGRIVSKFLVDISPFVR